MRAGATVAPLIVGLFAVVFASAASAQATTPSIQDFAKTYQATVIQAQQQCEALFADHVFDPLRTKIPLNGGKPTFAMLTNAEKVGPKDKAIATLAVKMVEKCRVAWEPVLALLPPQMNLMIQNLYRKQDAFIAELSTGKITFGEYNVAVDKIIGEATEIISGVSPSVSNPKTTTLPQTATTAKAPALIGRYFKDQSSVLPPGFSIPDPPNYRVEIDHLVFQCEKKKYALDKIEWWNASTQLVRMAIESNVAFSDIPDTSSYAVLQAMYCGQTYGGLGIRFTSEDNKLKVVEVFSGSPAEKSGLKVDDVITRVDGVSLDGLSVAQVISKTRGEPGTRISLSILRGDQATPIEISVTRENVNVPAAELDESK
jgi:hypothetical protein